MQRVQDLHRSVQNVLNNKSFEETFARTLTEKEIRERWLSNREQLTRDYKKKKRARFQ